MSIYTRDGQAVQLLASDPNTVDVRVKATGEVRAALPSWLRYAPKPKVWKPGAKARMGRQWNRRRKR